MLEYLLAHDSLIIFLVTAGAAALGYVLRKLHLFEETVGSVSKHNETIKHLDSELIELERKFVAFNSEIKVINNLLELLKQGVYESNSKIDLLHKFILESKNRQ